MPCVLRDVIHVKVIPCFLGFVVDLETPIGGRGLLQQVKVDYGIGWLKSFLGPIDTVLPTDFAKGISVIVFPFTGISIRGRGEARVTTKVWTFWEPGLAVVMS